MTKLQKINAGLTILDKYPDANIAVGHDILFAGSETPVSAEDEAALLALDWFINGESGDWAFWV